jgi:hypothetical protein
MVYNGAAREVGTLGYKDKQLGYSGKVEIDTHTVLLPFPRKLVPTALTVPSSSSCFPSYIVFTLCTQLNLSVQPALPIQKLEYIAVEDVGLKRPGRINLMVLSVGDQKGFEVCDS